MGYKTDHEKQNTAALRKEESQNLSDIETAVAAGKTPFDVPEVVAEMDSLEERDPTYADKAGAAVDKGLVEWDGKNPVGTASPDLGGDPLAGIPLDSTDEDIDG